jgi:uncharacterized protein YktB (UPF0637 family)
MKFKGFESADFDLFLIDGLEDRMAELKKQIRPKFEIFGDELAKDLSVITGEEMFPHVAKHARRKTNPPNDSWVAFSSNQRGYKMQPHFQITLWATHVLVQWGIIYEAKNKTMFAHNLILHLEEIIKSIPSNFQWCKDHMKPDGTLHSKMVKDDFGDFGRRLMYNKNGEIMVGLRIPKQEALLLAPEEFYEIVIETWSKLALLHNLARKYQF